MRNNKKIYITVLLIAAAFFLTACQSEKGKIKETLNTFQEACKDSDMEEMLNCLDPDMPGVQLIRSGSILAEMLTGEEISINDVMQEVFGESLNMDSFFEDISVKNAKCKINGESAVVTCSLFYENEGENEEEKVKIDMRKIDEKWYIAGFSIVEN